MGVSIAMVGCGAFAQCFIPLFKAHPLVSDIALCDVNKDKLRDNVERFGIDRTYPSLDEVCASDVDAAVIITQNWLHAPQAIQALRAGKHVYSAVPAGTTIEEITELVRTVEQTGCIYMMGETSYYRPEVVYCRKRYRAGDFGRIVYGEGHYYHDYDHALYDVMKWRGGKDWRKYAALPPMYYPTHSIGAVLGVTDTHLTHVSCLGQVDQHDDGLFKVGVNIWDNTFSNETALFRASDESAVRINEFRRIGRPSRESMSLWGTEASFEYNSAGAMWLRKDGTPNERLDDQLEPGLSREQVTGGMEKLGTDAAENFAQVHEVDRLPREFAGLPNGHGGSHQFLADDFVKACVSGEHPPVSAWRAARYTIPGLVAHESSQRGGELLEIPDGGAGPC